MGRYARVKLSHGFALIGRILVGKLAGDFFLPSRIPKLDCQIQKVEIIIKLQRGFLHVGIHSIFVPLYLCVQKSYA